MKKKLLISVCLLLLVPGLFYINKNYFKIWDDNSFVVSTDKNISKNKIKIEYGEYPKKASRKNDQEVFNYKSNILLFDGEKERNVPFDKDNSFFLISYDNNYYLLYDHTLDQTETANILQRNKFSFYFYLKDGIPKVNIVRDGNGVCVAQVYLSECRFAYLQFNNIPFNRKTADWIKQQKLR
jgi:hypothetical protein